MKYAITTALVGLAAAAPLVEKYGQLTTLLLYSHINGCSTETLEAREAKTAHAKGLGLLGLGPIGALLGAEQAAGKGGNAGLAALLDPLGILLGTNTGTQAAKGSGTTSGLPTIYAGVRDPMLSLTWFCLERKIRANDRPDHFTLPHR